MAERRTTPVAAGERDVLPGPVWPAWLLLPLGASMLFLELTDSEPRWHGLLLGVGTLAMGVWHLATRHTVLDRTGVKLPGDLRGRIGWTDITAVARSRMALHYRDVELSVRGRDRPVRIVERRGGRDFAAVERWWLRHGPGAAVDAQTGQDG